MVLFYTKKFQKETFLDGKSYFVIVESASDSVKGAIISVLDSDWPALDTYETKAYKREKILLCSGKSAWVYVKNS